MEELLQELDESHNSLSVVGLLFLTILCNRLRLNSKRVATSLDKVRMRVVNAAKKRVLHRFEHRQELSLFVVLPVNRVEELMQGLDVHVAHVLHSTHHLHKVGVLAEEVRLAKILLEEGILVKDRPCSIVKVNIVEEPIDTVSQDRQSVE